MLPFPWRIPFDAATVMGVLVIVSGLIVLWTAAWVEDWCARRFDRI